MFNTFKGVQQRRARYLWVLMVDAPKGSGVEEKLVESTAIHPVRIGRDSWFLHEDNFTRNSGVYCQQPPIHEPSIP
jgi:hypothetical protein